MYIVTIPGEPKGKARHRTTRYGHTYTPKENIEYENLVKTCFQDQNPNYKLLEGSLQAEIICYYSIPKSASKNKKEQMRRNISRPTKTPDADNVAKAVLDALNKTAFDDDKQIVELIVHKYYGDTPLVKLLIEEL